MPDDELENCADNQTLFRPDVLAAQTRRMLRAPRAHTLAENFGGQWLHFRSLESIRPDKLAGRRGSVKPGRYLV